MHFQSMDQGMKCCLSEAEKMGSHNICAMGAASAPMMPAAGRLPPHQRLRTPDFAFCFLPPFLLLPLEAPLPWALVPLCAAPFFCAS